jgi:hypothetical protein
MVPSFRIVMQMSESTGSVKDCGISSKPPPHAVPTWGHTAAPHGKHDFPP